MAIKQEVACLLISKDNGENPAESLFGHGAYTKKDSMLFNTNCIVKLLYSST